MEDLSFYFPEAFTHSLEDSAQKFTRLAETRICELSILASLAVDFYTEMLSEGLGTYDVLALLSEQRGAAAGIG